MALVGGVNPNFDRVRSAPRKYLIGWVLRAGAVAVASLAFAYFVMPPMTGPFWGLTFPILLAWAVNFGLSAAARSKPGTKKDFLRAIRFGGPILAVFVVIVLIRWLCGWS